MPYSQSSHNYSMLRHERRKENIALGVYGKLCTTCIHLRDWDGLLTCSMGRYQDRHSYCKPYQKKEKEV